MPKHWPSKMRPLNVASQFLRFFQALQKGETEIKIACTSATTTEIMTKI